MRAGVIREGGPFVRLRRRVLTGGGGWCITGGLGAHASGSIITEISPMRLIKFMALAALALVAAPAPAQVIQANPGYIPNVEFDGAAALSNTSYTNATTTPTVLTGASLTVPATSFDPAKQLYTACWSADATKSTATTGSIGVFVNGTVVTGSYRFISSASARGTLGGCFSWVRSSAAAQTVALYAVSADTNSFAVQNAQIVLVRRVFN